jgi:anti-sigma-K factor RskA
MTLDHSQIEELMAADALGGLDAEGRELLSRERATHGSCEECTRIEAEFAETAGRLGFTLVPLPVDDSVADEILRRAADAPAPPAADVVDLSRARTRAAPWRALIAVAAAFALIVAFVVARGPGGDTAVLLGAGPERLEVTFSPGEPGASLSGTGFEQLPAGQVYELWAIRDDAPIKATCFVPQEGDVDLEIDAEIETGDVMAVTVEPTCAPAPTTAPIITADTSNLS